MRAFARAAAAPPLLACACRPLLSAARTTAASVAALGAHRFAPRARRASLVAALLGAPYAALRSLDARAASVSECVPPRGGGLSLLAVSYIELVGVGCRRLPRPVLVLPRALYAPFGRRGDYKPVGTKRRLILYNRGSAPITGGFAALQNCRFV